jgi:hypothetical protein
MTRRRKTAVRYEPTVKELFDDGRAIDLALREAARDARRLHKALGNPMATWKDGQVVWVQPEDIQVEPRCPVPVTKEGSPSRRIDRIAPPGPGRKHPMRPCYGRGRKTRRELATAVGAARRLSARSTASSTRSRFLPTSSARKRRMR